MFKGEIIAVGTELLLGQIANTNAQYISQKMAEIGVPVYYHVTVGDNPERLKEAVRQAQKRSNLIIFTGGLGPTQDDITKETVAELVNKQLVLDKDSFDKIVKFFTQRQTTMTDNNIKQAMVIEGSNIFTNDFGLAVGMGFEDNNISYIFLPGPPFEMKPMLTQYVVPWIKDRHHDHTFYSKVMRFTGIGEASLEETIIDIIEAQTNPTIAPLASEGEVMIRLTAQGKDEETALSMIKPIEEEIHKRLEQYHFGYGEENIEQVVFKLLKESGLTISVSESCTGGLIGSQLTMIPGSSSVYQGGVICYNNEIKQRMLKVPIDVIATKGAVSLETAKILAENTLKIFDTDLAVSVTGIAGPDSIEDKPIGLIYIGISERGKETTLRELHFSGNRQFIQHRTAKFVFYYLWDRLKERLKK